MTQLFKNVIKHKDMFLNLSNNDKMVLLYIVCSSFSKFTDKYYYHDMDNDKIYDLCTNYIWSADDFNNNYGDKFKIRHSTDIISSFIIQTTADFYYRKPYNIYIKKERLKKCFDIYDMLYHDITKEEYNNIIDNFPKETIDIVKFLNTVKIKKNINLLK